MNMIHYDKQIIDAGDINLVHYEKLSAVELREPVTVNVATANMIFTREYTQGVIVYNEETPIRIEGTAIPKVYDPDVSFYINQEDIDYTVLTGLLQSSRRANHKRVYIRGRRGGLASHAGYTYWRNPYPNIRGMINYVI